MPTFPVPPIVSGGMTSQDWNPTVPHVAPAGLRKGHGRRAEGRISLCSGSSLIVEA